MSGLRDLFEAHIAAGVAYPHASEDYTAGGSLPFFVPRYIALAGLHKPLAFPLSARDFDALLAHCPGRQADATQVTMTPAPPLWPFAELACSGLGIDPLALGVKADFHKLLVIPGTIDKPLTVRLHENDPLEGGSSPLPPTDASAQPPAPAQAPDRHKGVFGYVLVRLPTPSAGYGELAVRPPGSDNGAVTLYSPTGQPEASYVALYKSCTVTLSARGSPQLMLVFTLSNTKGMHPRYIPPPSITPDHTIDLITHWTAPERLYVALEMQTKGTTLNSLVGSDKAVASFLQGLRDEHGEPYLEVHVARVRRSVQGSPALGTYLSRRIIGEIFSVEYSVCAWDTSFLMPPGFTPLDIDVDTDVIGAKEDPDAIFPAKPVATECIPTPDGWLILQHHEVTSSHSGLGPGHSTSPSRHRWNGPLRSWRPRHNT